MTREEIDKLWFQACEEAANAGEQFGRYRFAELIAEAEREACVADNVQGLDEAIRARGTK